MTWRGFGESIFSIFSSLSILGIFVVIPAYGIGSFIYDYYKVTCSKQAIRYETKTVYDDSLLFFETKTTTEGVDGVREVCKRGNGDTVSNRVLAEPVTEVLREGTDAEPIYTNPPQGNYRTGAICMDGTYSYATGRGACSWHGGVSRWLYE